MVVVSPTGPLSHKYPSYPTTTSAYGMDTYSSGGYQSSSQPYNPVPTYDPFYHRLVCSNDPSYYRLVCSNLLSHTILVNIALLNVFSSMSHVILVTWLCVYVCIIPHQHFASAQLMFRQILNYTWKNK